jgi:hypothetical protein
MMFSGNVGKARRTAIFVVGFLFIILGTAAQALPMNGPVP